MMAGAKLRSNDAKRNWIALVLARIMVFWPPLTPCGCAPQWIIAAGAFGYRADCLPQAGARDVQVSRRADSAKYPPV